MNYNFKHIWVVEINCYEKGEYYPTVGIGLDRVRGRLELEEWKSRNPGSKFRLKKYVPVK